MYKVNQSLENDQKKYLNTVWEDGIWKGLVLTKTNYNTEYNRIELEFQQESSGRFTTIPLYPSKDGASALKIAYDMSVVEHVFKAVVAPKIDPVTGKDIRFGTTAPTLETFKDVYDYYVAAVDLNNQVLVNIKGLYKSNVVAQEEGKPAYPPKTVNGDMPFITSK